MTFSYQRSLSNLGNTSKTIFSFVNSGNENLKKIYYGPRKKEKTKKREEIKKRNNNENEEIEIILFGSFSIVISVGDKHDIYLT